MKNQINQLIIFQARIKILNKDDDYIFKNIRKKQ